MNIIQKKIEEIFPYENNPRRNEMAVEAVASSIKEFGFKVPIIIDKSSVIVCGHTRYKAALKLNLIEVPCVVADDLSEEQIKAYRLADNKVSELAEWDEEKLLAELEALDSDIDMSAFDFNMSDFEQALDSFDIEEAKNPLEDTFLIPPFSVLDTALGRWCNRKRQWNMLIKKEGETRENTLGFASLLNDKYKGHSNLKTVSIFDPVLAEIIALWFTPYPKCNIFDPFAGGASGFVYAYLGHNFTGIELRKEQADINNERVENLTGRYICDDGQNLLNHIKEDSQDLMFSCPPYFNLEKYSELENDASNQKDYEGFRQILENAFTAGVKALRNNRFAVIVMSNVRDKKGAYIDICSDITKIMQKNGLVLYNELILKNSIGTAPIRARRAMNNRKSTRIHQEVLVYYKGDICKIKDTFKGVDIDIDLLGDEQGIKAEDFQS